jgi:hypothetical protein
MKKMLMIAVITVLTNAFLFAALPFILGGISGGFQFYRVFFKGFIVPKMPKPKITYGEFTFTFVYEVNGEEKVVEDVLICKYDGVKWAGDFSYSRRYWKHSFKSGNIRLTLLQIDEINEIYYIIPSSAGSQMGDGEPWTGYVPKDAWLAEIDYEIRGYHVSEEELLNKYGIRIISWEIDPPIKNTFK